MGMPDRAGKMEMEIEIEIEAEVEGIRLRHIRPTYTHQSILVFAADLLFRSSANFVFKEALINSQSPIIHVFSCNTAS